MKYNELYRILKEHGWTLKGGKRKGGHDKFVHPDFGHSIFVGRHQSQEVPIGTLKSILKEARIE